MNAVFLSCLILLCFFENRAGQFPAIAQGLTTVLAACGGIRARFNLDDSIQTKNRYDEIRRIIQKSQWGQQVSSSVFNKSYQIGECNFRFFIAPETHTLSLRVISPHQTFTVDAVTFLQIAQSPQDDQHLSIQDIMIKNTANNVTSSFFHYKRQIYFYGWCCLIGSGFLLWEMIKYTNRFSLNNEISQDYYV